MRRGSYLAVTAFLSTVLLLARHHAALFGSSPIRSGYQTGATAPTGPTGAASPRL